MNIEFRYNLKPLILDDKEQYIRGGQDTLDDIKEEMLFHFNNINNDCNSCEVIVHLDKLENNNPGIKIIKINKECLNILINTDYNGSIMNINDFQTD